MEYVLQVLPKVHPFVGDGAPPAVPEHVEEDEFDDDLLQEIEKANQDRTSL